MQKKTNNRINKIIAGLKNYSHAIIVCIVLIMSIIMLLSTYSLSFFPINNEYPQSYNTGWTYSVDDGEFVEITFPNNIEQEVEKNITIKNKLPPILVKGATVLFRTSQQAITVFVDDEIIYSSLSETNKAVSSAYHFIRLPQDSFNKELTIVVTSPIARYNGLLNDVQIGSKASLLYHLFEENGLRFVLGLIQILFGFILIIANIFAKSSNKKTGMTYLGCFFAASGLWIAVESRLMQLIIPFPLMMTNLSIFALTLTPIFCSLYFLITHLKHTEKFMRWLVMVMSLGSFSVFVLSLINVTLPLRILPTYIAFLGVFIVAFFSLIFIEHKKAKSKFAISVIGILVFVIFALIELLVYLSNVNMFNNSHLFTIGLFLFCFILFIELIQNSSKAYKEAVSVNALKKLVYTDNLTGLLNRTAFIERMSNIDLKSFKEITVAMFDINDLKYVNDTLGHLSGDYLIIECGKILEKALSTNLVYRIGGDEFVVLINKNTKFDKTETIRILLKESEQQNLILKSIRLDFAYGFATYDDVSDETLFKTFERADKEMYECKRQQKELENKKIADLNEEL